MSAKDVIKLIEDQGVKFIDFRFTDTIGKEQHVVCLRTQSILKN